MDQETAAWIRDGIIAGATVVGPIAAVQIQRGLERQRAYTDQKQQIFQTLLSNRARPITAEGVNAINLLEVAWSGRSGFRGRHKQTKSEKAVTESFKEYWVFLGSLPSDADQQRKERFEERRRDIYRDLLYLMALDLGYSFDKAHLTSPAYLPLAHVLAANEGEMVRKTLLAALDSIKRAIDGGQPEKVVTAVKDAVLGTVAERAAPPGQS